jgi:NADPH2:quinone reductase
MQGLGGVRAQRPGGYAEYVTVDASAVALLSDDVDPVDMAALGLASVTAFEGLRRLGNLKDRRIAVTGASGGVGSAAVAIANAQGAQVIGVISRSAQAEYVRSVGAAKTYSSQDVAAGALGSETIDGLLDTVAGSSFGSYVTALRPGGILSLVGAVGAVGGGEVAFDAYRLLEVTLTGYSSETLDGAALRQAVCSISELLRQGAFTAPPRTVLPLREAAAAHTRLEQHLVQGRVLLIPDSGT